MKFGAAVVLVLATAGCLEREPEAVCTGVATATNEIVIDTACMKGADVDALAACLATSGPDDCQAKVPGAGPRCDSDGDGVSDDLESALARAYAPVFAFNGGALGGDAETHWPGNAAQFVSGARLAFGNKRTLVDAHPTLESLALATHDGRRADNPCPGEGAEFWLCANDDSDAARVSSVASMRALPGGIDVLTVVHPADNAHVFVSFGLFFPFNAHSTVDDHEGDWESIAVFVNRKTGAVDAGWFDRHKTVDNLRLISSASYAPRDPRAETSQGNVGAESGAMHGLRFWDYEGARRHVVAYVSTGGHAMYDYPANTRIFRYGPRDTHSGDGPKLVVFSSSIAATFGGTEGETLEMRFVNPGEPSRITLPWARFRGQWGCTDRHIAKSWPGPFGNARHPRPMFERTWDAL